MTDMVCYCNCCKKTENGRGVDSLSCVKKDFLGKDMSNEQETCSCYCEKEKGPKGVTGCEGPPGPPGDRGIDGIPGLPGVDGIHGKPGYAGAPGSDGSHKPDCRDGNDGGRGILGVPGRDGRQGEAGRNGEDGPNGGAGKNGVRGPPGPPGPKGRPGRKGPNGPNGYRGIRGETGLDGPNGMMGKRGPAGAPGAQGKAGMPGQPGIEGIMGPRGDRGIDGADGANGPRGRTGRQGLAGNKGRAGRNSNMRGHQGEPGDNGIRGEAGDDAVFDWRVIEAMIADQLYMKLMKPSAYCGEITEMCKCGEVKVIPKRSEPVIVTEPTVEDPRDVLDVILLMDGSDSISIQDWPVLKKWVLKFMNTFSEQEYIQRYAATSTKVIVQYSSYDSETPNQENYIVKKRLLHQLKAFEEDLNAMIQLAEGTDTFTAIEFVLNEVIPNQMDTRGNHFRQLVLLTDGVPRDGAIEHLSNGQRRYSNQELYSMLSQTFNDRYVVGIGSEVANNDYDNLLRDVSFNSNGGNAIWFVDRIRGGSDRRASYLNDEIMDAILSEMRMSLLS